MPTLKLPAVMAQAIQHYRAQLNGQQDISIHIILLQKSRGLDDVDRQKNLLDGVGRAVGIVGSSAG
jgi:hypothetical protein